ncbi:hypothetical protein [Schlesneria paludicola]|uniref:hypothetical protein n=1 Tax=Schlesneria paludicola TaxID=360056 RepID=UPI000311CD78|nr:hypothetical protein [Schlesneria paludicola]
MHLTISHSRIGDTLQTVIALIALSMGTISSCLADEILIGGATVSVTPDQPVALWGQMSTRISAGVESPVTATVLALESRRDGQSTEQSIMVACDLVAIPDEVLLKTRQRVTELVPEFPVAKIFLSATHTHTGPVMNEGIYAIPPTGVMQPTEYVHFFAERVAAAIVSAWTKRKPGKVGWGLGHAVVAQNRRAVFDDGTAAMYGRTTENKFRMFEGYEDHGVEVLCCWDADDKLIATAINLACPAQEVEGRSFVNADLWHDVREKLRAEHGSDLHVLAWTGAAGDQSPHLMFRKAAEERMMKLRGLDRLKELSRRLVAAWKEAYDGAKLEKLSDVPLIHQRDIVELPRREVTGREWELAKAKLADLSKQTGMQTLLWWHGGVVRRYEQQQAGTAKPYTMELHTIRLGDIAIATNPFELYTDFGIQMKARSPALQTFVIQLAGPGTYLPSQRAVEGGGYSAIAESNEVGPEGGQILVEKTLAAFQKLWATAK